MDLKKLAQASIISVVVTGLVLSVIYGITIGVDFLVNRYNFFWAGMAVFMIVVIVIFALCVYESDLMTRLKEANTVDIPPSVMARVFSLEQDRKRQIMFNTSLSKDITRLNRAISNKDAEIWKLQSQLTNIQEHEITRLQTNIKRIGDGDAVRSSEISKLQTQLVYVQEQLKRVEERVNVQADNLSNNDNLNDFLARQEREMMNKINGARSRIDVLEDVTKAVGEEVTIIREQLKLVIEP